MLTWSTTVGKEHKVTQKMKLALHGRTQYLFSKNDKKECLTFSEKRGTMPNIGQGVRQFQPLKESFMNITFSQNLSTRGGGGATVSP